MFPLTPFPDVLGHHLYCVNNINPLDKTVIDFSCTGTSSLQALIQVTNATSSQPFYSANLMFALGAILLNLVLITLVLYKSWLTGR